MMYRSPDGHTFNTYQAFCHHMEWLSNTSDEKQYWRNEAEKMTKRLHRWGPIVIPILIAAPILLLLVSTCQ